MYQKRREASTGSMASIVKILRVAADPNRLRILMLLRAEELSVAELQEILAMGQSTISTHLAQLKQAGLVEDRRTGKSNLYRIAIRSESEVGARLAEKSALKGHDFSRADTARKESGALAPEGQYWASITLNSAHRGQVRREAGVLTPATAAQN